MVIGKLKIQEKGNESEMNKMLMGIIGDAHKTKIRRLEDTFLDNEISLEALRADNNHLLLQLEEKDVLLRDWVEFFEAFEHKQELLEDEMKNLRMENRRKPKRNGFLKFPKNHSDSETF